jgi:hypothetical protein
VVFNIFCFRIKPKFVKIDKITPNYLYYKIFNWYLEVKIPRRWFCTTLNEPALKICCLNKVFKFFIIFHLINTHKYGQFYINNPNYVCYKILLLTLPYEHFTTVNLQKKHNSTSLKTGVWRSYLWSSSFSASKLHINSSKLI